MANKLPKRLFGPVGLTAPNIPVRFKSGGSVSEGYISKQVGARRFKCLPSVPSSPPESAVTCKIVEGTNMDPANNGEMTIVGLINGSQPVTLRKLNFRTASDFSGNRYKWSLSDDSTQTLIILTAI